MFHGDMIVRGLPDSSPTLYEIDISFLAVGDHVADRVKLHRSSESFSPFILPVEPPWDTDRLVMLPPIEMSAVTTMNATTPITNFGEVFCFVFTYRHRESNPDLKGKSLQSYHLTIPVKSWLATSDSCLEYRQDIWWSTQPNVSRGNLI